jgi:hypothetical protein
MHLAAITAANRSPGIMHRDAITGSPSAAVTAANRSQCTMQPLNSISIAKCSPGTEQPYTDITAANR